MSDFDFPYVDAILRDERNPRYANNIYSRALPALVDQATMVTQLTHLPLFDPLERLLPPAERIQRLDIIGTVLFALPRVARLGQAMLKMLHTGYAGRAPFSKADHQFQRDMYARQQAGTLCSVRNIEKAPQLSMSLIGSSGSGKSFTLEHIMGLLPPVIYHASHGLWQIPFLYIEMSTDGESVHSLASALFEKLDELLPHSGYRDMYVRNHRGNAELRLMEALRLARTHGVGMIVVDESQNKRNANGEQKVARRNSSSDAHRKEESPLTKLLITASNVSHIPILFAGTLEMQRLFERFTKGRRFAGHGSETWYPLERSGDLEQPGDFECLLLALWRYQWVQQPVDITAGWVDLFFHYTQGIPDMVAKLFETVQVEAIDSGIETLTPELLALAFEREFKSAELAITALRERDMVLLEAVPDLHQPCNMERRKDESVQIPLAKRPVIRKRAPPDPYTPKEPREPKAKPASAAPRPVEIAVPREADLRHLGVSSSKAHGSIPTKVRGPILSA